METNPKGKAPATPMSFNHHHIPPKSASTEEQEAKVKRAPQLTEESISR